MIKKYCPHCRKFSYSAKAKGKWLCPNCNYDLIKERALPLDDLDRDRGIRPMAFSLTGCSRKGGE